MKLLEKMHHENGCLAGISSRIFIAGTGRSGTTILHRILSRHPSIYSVPRESKFIVEGDGLQRLVASLWKDYSVTQSGLDLERFEHLMRIFYPRKEATEEWEKNWQYDRLIGEDIYYDCLDEFIGSVTNRYSDGTLLPKMFEGKEELLVLSRRFVDRMFGTPALRSGKIGWLEKTPSNIIAMDFLWELFPDATIIHIKRDPRGVYHSLMNQSWAPSDPEAVAAFLGNIYLRWQRLKESYLFDHRRYIEIKLEDFVRQPKAILNAICETAGLSPKNWGPPDIDVSAPDNWRTQLSLENRKLCEERLGRFFPMMGYEI